MHYYIDNDRPTIRFSEQAWLIIKEDRENFSRGEPLSTFLNTIFSNFHKEAKCSLSILYQKLFTDFNTLKSNLLMDPKFKKLDQTSMNTFISTYLDDYTDELMKNIVNIESINEHSEKIRLDQNNQNTLDKLQTEDCFYEEDKFVKQYLKAIFEEYARLPAYRREQVYLKNTFQIIKDAIDEGRQLKIWLTPKFSATTQKHYQRIFHISPYDILQDPANIYNYLVGYTQELKDGALLEGRPSSFRLSKIEDVTTLLGKSALTKTKQASIEKAIRENGIQFLAGDAIEVIVRFNQKGLANLKQQTYMRPLDREIIDECETHTTYSFVCTEVQAMNYFFKFGKHAYIVEPDWLREKFKKRYLESYKSYLENEKSEITENEQLEKYTKKISKLKKWLEEE